MLTFSIGVLMRLKLRGHSRSSQYRVHQYCCSNEDESINVTLSATSAGKNDPKKDQWKGTIGDYFVLFIL